MDHKQFAVAAVLEIARHERDAPTANPLSVSELSARFGLNPRGLEFQFQILRGAGILVGLRGPKGGYKIGASPKALSIHKIHAALDSASGLDPHLPEEVAARPEVRVVQSAFQGAESQSTRFLAGLTIADLLARIPQQKAAA